MFSDSRPARSMRTRVVLPAPISPVTRTKPSFWKTPNFRYDKALLWPRLPKKKAGSGLSLKGDPVKPKWVSYIARGGAAAHGREPVDRGDRFGRQYRLSRSFSKQD